MQILYTSCLCSENKYKDLFGKIIFKPGQQVQKYHRLIVEGLSKIDGVKVKIITTPPTTRLNNKKLFSLYFVYRLKKKTDLSIKEIIRSMFLGMEAYKKGMSYIEWKELNKSKSVNKDIP